MNNGMTASRHGSHPRRIRHCGSVLCLTGPGARGMASPSCGYAVAWHFTRVHGHVQAIITRTSLHAAVGPASKHTEPGIASQLNQSEHRLAAWLTSLERRVNPNIAAVAPANKLARIAWAVLTRGETYGPA